MATFETIISGTDAWGTVHKAKIRWRSRKLTGLDHGRDNVDLTERAWGSVDDPPVRFVRDAVGGGVSIRPLVRRFEGSEAWALEAEEASGRSLSDGDFFVVEQWAGERGVQLTVRDVAERVGRSVATIRSARQRGSMPDPDGFTGRTPWWSPETIDEWRARVEEE